ncbi:SpoIIIAH-like family protein [Thermohalobacter berrensis]|uniref:Stage III sporulation protein AH n=1 Tax=Thermohalobacter berrensis TaxID=99594 RepID=A0A419TAS1_9FIRM|nr:SpoIIIAH-like family protein [Thermohalobacter berrensis]RKD34570.1 stage III sporulation protein AH [Thermohalobacter berrensis]
MVIRKKTILLVSLIILLIVVGYINHQLTKQSLLESSAEYQQHEQTKLNEVQKLDNVNLEETSGKNVDIEDSDIEIVESTESQVSELTMETNNHIEEAISREGSRKSRNYFIEYRLSRDKLRAGLIDRLKEIINNEKTEQEIRSQAQKEIIRIGKLAEKELYIEGLIKAKGFEDALVFLKENSARIVVDADELNEQEVMQILEIIKNEANIEPSNIKIMKKFN